MDKFQNYDDQLLRFEGVRTPLFDLMLKASVVEAESVEFDHFFVNEKKSVVTLIENSGDDSPGQSLLHLSEVDCKMVKPNSMLLVRGVPGYDSEGKNQIPGEDLILYVEKIDPTTGKPVVVSINGRLNQPDDKLSVVPVIPAGTTIVILPYQVTDDGTASDIPALETVRKRVYLGKRPLSEQSIAYLLGQSIDTSDKESFEREIANFKVTGGVEILESVGHKTELGDIPCVNSMTGVREQIQKSVSYSGTFDVSGFVSLAKSYFGDAYAPKKGILLAGSGFLTNLLPVDFMKVTDILSLFGSLDIVYEPAFDNSGLDRCGVILDPDSLVHYVHSSEDGFSEALVLNGSHHLWINYDETKA